MRKIRQPPLLLCGCTCVTRGGISRRELPDKELAKQPVGAGGAHWHTAALATTLSR